MNNPEPEDIIEFVENWRKSHGDTEDEILTNEQITSFVADFQEQISLMDYSRPNETTIIGYSGQSNGCPCWKIVDAVSNSLVREAFWIISLSCL